MISYVYPDTHVLHWFLFKQVKHGDEQDLQVLLDVSKYYVPVQVGIFLRQDREPRS